VAIEIKILRRGDAAVLDNVAPDVFDHAIDPLAAEAFVADARHHIAVAIDAGVVVGFASGTHYFHPDKPVPELFVNEVGVSPDYQRRGVGKATLGALLELGRALGCEQAWVLTDRTNVAAMRLYAGSGGSEATSDPTMFSFHLGKS
jgi:aminoglycoside 6'-N-acetyltransferase I